MKFLFGCLLSVFLVGVYSYVCAQTGTSSVAGRVITDDHLPAESATVTVFKSADSSVIVSTVCDNNGQFKLAGLRHGNYFILIRKIGYKKFYSGQYHLIDGKTIDAGVITLTPSDQQLGEVTVNAKKNYIEVFADKTVLNVDKSIVTSGNSVYDVLSTAPGVRIEDNAILFKAGQKALIAINGKPIGNFTDEQLADLLKSYQSSMISQIELIPNPSAKYDATGGGGVINIILKKSKDVGFRANVTESAAYGQGYKFNSGINLNYRTDKFNVFGNYSFADNKSLRMLDIDRNIYNANDVANFDVNYKSTSYAKISNFNTGVDYTITPKQTFGVLVYGYYSSAGIDKNSITHIRNNGSLDSNLTTESHVDRDITNRNYNLNYKGSFGKNDATSLAADVDYSTYDRTSFELVKNDFYLTDGTTYRDPLYYTDNSPSNINIRSELIDFTQQLTKNSSLSAGLKNTQVNSDNTIDFEQKVDTGVNFLPIPSLTDHFIYKERVNAAYGIFNGKFNKSDLTIGLRAEQTYSYGISYHPDKTVTRTYFDLFPNLQLIQSVDTLNQLTVGYNRRINRPNYQDLNPFVGFIGEYAYSTGNPFLKPEYFNTYAISDLYKNKYKFSFDLTVTKDFFAPVFLQNDSTKVYTTTFANIGTRYEYEAEFTTPIDVTKWWNINIDLKAAYEHYVYNLDSARKSSYDINVYIDQTFSITKGLKAELYGTYESPTYYGIKQYQQQYSVRAGLSQSVLHDDGSIRLAVSDIFNSDIYKYTSNYDGLDLTGREKSGTRFVTLSFVYHFGKNTVKSMPKRVGGNVDDQKRLGGSTNEN